MIEDIKHFYENNSTMILIAIATSVLIVGFMMYQRMNNSSNISAFNGTGSETSATQFSKLSDMNCDIDSGVCYTEDTIPHLSQGQDQETIQKQMMMHQQMMMQQQQIMEQNQAQQQQQQQQQQQGNQQMSPEQEEQMMMQQQMMQQQMMQQQQSENNGGQ